ncbi:MAG TPA: hypothetical protein VG097_06185 [Gemmata sp.]|jgi:hypothetical protein|nr:hypothetical protein [Gemmata sp.]
MQRLILALSLTGFLGCVLACEGTSSNHNRENAKNEIVGQTRQLDGWGDVDQPYPKDLPFLHKDDPAIGVWVTASVSKEDRKLKELETSGQSITLAGNPHVKVLQINGGYARVEVLDGPHKGKTGWVNETWILPDGKPPNEDPLKQQREEKFGPAIKAAQKRVDEAKAPVARMPNDQDYRRALEQAEAQLEALKQQAHDWRPPKR